MLPPAGFVSRLTKRVTGGPHPDLVDAERRRRRVRPAVDVQRRDERLPEGIEAFRVARDVVARRARGLRGFEALRGSAQSCGGYPSCGKRARSVSTSNARVERSTRSGSGVQTGALRLRRGSPNDAPDSHPVPMSKPVRIALRSLCSSTANEYVAASAAFTSAYVTSGAAAAVTASVRLKTRAGTFRSDVSVRRARPRSRRPARHCFRSARRSPRGCAASSFDRAGRGCTG